MPRKEAVRMRAKSSVALEGSGTTVDFNGMREGCEVKIS